MGAQPTPGKPFLVDNHYHTSDYDSENNEPYGQDSNCERDTLLETIRIISTENKLLKMQVQKLSKEISPRKPCANVTAYMPMCNCKYVNAVYSEKFGETDRTSSTKKQEPPGKEPDDMLNSRNVKSKFRKSDKNYCIMKQKPSAIEPEE